VRSRANTALPSSRWRYTSVLAPVRLVIRP
jgi:hypothetical protein